MAELRIVIPEELKRKMEKFKIDWPSVARDLLKKEVDELSELKAMVSKSMLTEEEALALSRKVNKSLAKRFRESAMR
ncbi:MAG: hypothetical protein QME59_00495 [Candidatus Hydrothermarchaeota archaeon]|nr:hypothetical protein [Candidatus Hydrothermarchaeota archaeon]